MLEIVAVETIVGVTGNEASIGMNDVYAGFLESERQTHRHPAEFQLEAKSDRAGQRLEKKMRMTGEQANLPAQRRIIG